MNTPWDFLEGYRNTHFNGEWPTIPQMFAITADRYPERRCFTAFEPVALTLTYSEALGRIRGVAARMVELGVAPGDRVAVTGKNSPEWAVAYLGTLFSGAVVVPIDYGLSVEETAGLVEFSGARAIFVDSEKFDSFAPGTAGLKDRFALAGGGENYILDLPSVEATQPGEVVRADSEDAAGEELAAILFTSGTTGNPKGVMLTHNNLVSDCYLSQGNLNIGYTDVFYALLPIHHSYTMLAVFIEAISVGAELVFGKRLAVAQIFRELKEGKVTMFLGVPALFNKLIKGINKGLRDKGILVYGLMKTLMGLSGLIKKVFRVNPGKALFGSVLKKVSLDTNRICISGGGPLPVSTFRQFNQLGIDFVQGYGLTETSPIVTLNPTNHFKLASVGRIVEQCQIRIANPDSDGNGEIQISGPMVMKGYYKNPEATKETFTEDGWLKTGDIGHLDNENYLYLTGRAKSLIVTDGGKNVFPEEIENEFQLYDEIEQILVRGYVKDAAMKVEGVEALFFPTKDFTTSVKDDSEAVRNRFDELVREVNARMPMYKRIDTFRILDEPLEMTTTRKIKRHTAQ